jgi:hypothetical protein
MGAVVAAALALLLAGLGAGSAPTRHASLRLVKVAPLQLRGTGFQALEQVRVVARMARLSGVKHVRASARGSFSVAFSLTPGHCSGLRVLALGNAGSRATLKRRPLPGCMPQ